MKSTRMSRWAGILGLLSTAFAAPAASIYWIEYRPQDRRIARAPVLDGQTIETLFSGGRHPRPITLDPVAGKMYWGDTLRDQIFRANLDGTGDEVVANAVGNIVGVALDTTAGKVYWLEGGTSKILSANLDGSAVEELLSGQWSIPSGPVLDVQAGTIYYATAGCIYRANLDGSQHALVVCPSPTGGIRAIAIDSAAGKLFWTDIDLNLVKSANLDGSGIQTVAGSPNPAALWTAPTEGKVYWADGLAGSVVHRANLNGTGQEQLVSAVSIHGLAVDSAAGKLYFSNNDLKIQRVNTDGSGLEDIVVGEIRYASPIALDADSGAVVWGELEAIRRLDLQSSSIDLLIEDSNVLPRNLALDLANGKAYWSDVSGRVIRRGNLDGTGIEDLVNFADVPDQSLVLDSGAGKLYWLDSNDGTLQRANLDGGDVELILSGLDYPSGLALDEVAGRLFWGQQTPAGGRSLNGANVDGSDVQELVVDLDGVGSLAWDPFNLKVYWATSSYFSGTASIRRANFNGSNVQNVVTGLADVHGIALDLLCTVRPFGDLDLSGVVDVDDLLLGLGGFIDPLAFPQADIEPCGGDGDIDVDDILMELNVFAGIAACPDPCY